MDLAAFTVGVDAATGPISAMAEGTVFDCWSSIPIDCVAGTDSDLQAGSRMRVASAAARRILRTELKTALPHPVIQVLI